METGAAGGTWPVAVLCGAAGAALLALGAWLCAWVAGDTPSWPLPAWLAEHALWGTLIGWTASGIVRLCARLDPHLADPAERRAAVARQALFLVVIAAACLVTAARARPSVALVGLLAGAALAWVGLRTWMRQGGHRRPPAPLAAARVAVVLTVFTLPLTFGSPVAGRADAGEGSVPAQVLAGHPVSGASTVWAAWCDLLGC